MCVGGEGLGGGSGAVSFIDQAGLILLAASALEFWDYRHESYPVEKDFLIRDFFFFLSKMTSETFKNSLCSF